MMGIRRIAAIGLAVVLLVWCAAGLAAEPGGPAREENFDGRTVKPQWEQVLGDGATITVKDGWATFEAPVGADCHVQQKPPGDNITVSAHLARWAGIYLVWDQDNWCGVGKISPTPFGRFYSIAVIGGKPVEVDHRGIDFNGRHDVRVRLGTDHVTFQYQLDGRWTELRTIERPGSFEGAPRLVAAGIAYTDEDKPFAKSSPAQQHGSEKRSGAIDDLHIEPTPPPDLVLTAAQLEAVRHPPEEPVNALLHKSDADPTYDQIVGSYPPFRYPREIVGVPDHPLDIGVDWLGRIDVSPWTPPLAWFEIGDPPRPFGKEGKPFKRQLDQGYLPIVTLSREDGDLNYETTVFGWSKDFSPDQDLFACASVTVRPLASDAILPQTLWLVWDGGKQRRAIKPVAADGQRAKWVVRFKFPDPATVQSIAPEDFQSIRDSCAKAWGPVLGPARPMFQVPDPRVMNAYRAWIAYSALDTDKINGFAEPHDGSGFYEEMFGYSVALHAIAMDQYGLHDRAAAALATQVHYQHRDGLYTQACGLCDPGAFLMALAKHYQITGDRAWLSKVAPAMAKQCDWLIHQRQQAPKEGMLKGMIKFRPYNDYPAPTYNYLGNALCARGMILAGEVLGEIGVDDAAKFAAEGAQYRKDILASMQAAVFPAPDSGQMLLPMEPDTHRLLKLGKNRGGDYWGLVASPLLASEILSPDDAPSKQIVGMLEQRGGLIAGVCEFDRGIDHAYTYGYLLNELRRGEVRKTLLGFWSFLAFGMTRDTFSPVEVTMIQTGENQLTLPHLYSCTQQLRLLRAMLVREDGDVLWLGQGLPREWLEPGKLVAVQDAPTFFGPLSYRLDPQADGSIRVHIDPPMRRPAREIRLCLRDPQSREIAAVQAPGAQEIEHAGQTITLRRLRGPTDLVVRFAK